MIDPKSLFATFSRHVASCRSAPFVLNARASFEQWFVVELYPALIDLGYGPDQVERAYLYPDRGKRGDLALRSPALDRTETVFEFKPFVANQDAQKSYQYPQQIRALEILVGNQSIDQAVAFVTFIGYSDRRLQTLMTKFFSDTGWQIEGPRTLAEGFEMKLAIGSLTADTLSGPRP